MSPKLSIADNIRIMRENLGYSQEYVATQLNITQQAYSSLEKNVEKITIKRSKDLTKIFDVKVITLLDEENALFSKTLIKKEGTQQHLLICLIILMVMKN